MWLQGDCFVVHPTDRFCGLVLTLVTSGRLAPTKIPLKSPGWTNPQKRCVGSSPPSGMMSPPVGFKDGLHGFFGSPNGWVAWVEDPSCFKPFHQHVRNWLVVTGCHQFYFPRNIGLRLSSQLTNSIIFQRGGKKPPTSIHTLHQLFYQIATGFRLVNYEVMTIMTIHNGAFHGHGGTPIAHPLSLDGLCEREHPIVRNGWLEKYPLWRNGNWSGKHGAPTWRIPQIVSGW